ncbi:MAG: hypothetical protein B0D92_08040 [Spirochaeta sp. LUC14_002_19_P3]|nr:MAG: hypothetical protein B0D92_08040 [Spirochaeta sp. LUC14_002_19_P3]
MLLKTLAPLCTDRIRRVLDVGCGAGALGLAIAARCPQASIVLADRDFLAVSFSAHNARLNGLKNTAAIWRLMLEAPHEAAYDLIVCNFPAKAGEPVLKDFLQKVPSLLKPEGRAALVIVNPLARCCRELVLESGGEILTEENSTEHTVFHCRCSAPIRSLDAEANLLLPYIRRRGAFEVSKISYSLDTVWNIPDFDTISWRLELAGRLMPRLPSADGCMVFWEPGQGHLPLLAVARGNLPRRIILAGRDRLALLASEHNLHAYSGMVETEILPLCEPGALSEALEPASVDLLVTDINPIPRSAWNKHLPLAAAALVKPGGFWMAVGRSSNMAELMKNTKGWFIQSNSRSRGWRAAVLERRAPR